MTRFWICLWFWIYHGSEYHRVTQGSEYALIIPEYAWLWLNMPTYACICVNKPRSTWMALVLHFPLVMHCLFERMVTFFQTSHETRKMGSGPGAVNLNIPLYVLNHFKFSYISLYTSLKLHPAITEESLKMKEKSHVPLLRLLHCTTSLNVFSNAF